MALKPVQDPALLAALDGGAPALAGPKAVTDPALLAQLEGRQPSLDDEIPMQPATPAPQQQPDDLFTRVSNAVAGDPIIDMWLSGLKNIGIGAPEVAMNAVGNIGVQGAAGLSAPMLTSDPDDQANFIQDFTAENSMQPQGENAKQLTEGLGRAMEPVGNIKRLLGEKTLEATGSPLAATAADMVPDLAATMLGGRPAVQGAEALPKKALAADSPVSPIVEDLRAADVRLRPSDVRAMHPGAKKIPGERREKFADAPDLKKDLSLHNQDRYTKLGSEELELDDVGVDGLTDAQYAKAKEAPAATYNMVEDVLRDKPVSEAFQKAYRDTLDSIKLELPKGKANTILGTLGAIRKRAAKRLQSDNPEMEAKGFADRNMADALDEALGKELEARGEPQLVEELRAARERFGKIHDLETATRAGQIDAAVMYKLGQKKKLTGRLKLIADAYEHAPNVSGHSTKTAARAGEEVPGSREGIIKEGIKKLVRSVPGMDVGKKGFQEKLGPVDPTRTANYGRETEIAPLPDPSQGSLDLRDVLGLEAPPGTAPRIPMRPTEGPQSEAFAGMLDLEAPPGTAPRIPMRPTEGPQSEAFAGMFDLEAPPGTTGVPSGASVAENLGDVMIGGEALAEPIQNFSAMSLADLLGLSEPLVKAPKKPKR